jgi:hypothetical protein
LEKVLRFVPEDSPEICDLSDLFENGLTQDMAIVIRGIRHYEAAVNAFLGGLIPRLDNAELCDRRNLVQHSVMSLLPASELQAETQVGAIYEPCRIALIIYCLTVIFPLPTQTAQEPLATLSGALRNILECDDDFQSWTDSSARLLVWIMVIGGVVARDRMDDRAWWVNCLRKRTVNRITNFEDLKAKVLTEFVWLERSCDAAGAALWSEVCRQEEGSSNVS